MKAAAHPQQAQRLTTLRRYEILDTPREEDFDDIALLASNICGTPIAVVNLIDEHRQWFKAEVGLGARETPLDTSICSHVILEEDFVEINDTLTDERTADNELCLNPDNGLRFYAGALLKADNGMAIGTLCVLDTKPNALNDLQKQTLKVLARRVMRELELRYAIKIQDDLRHEMDHRVKNSLQTISSNLRLQNRIAERTGEWLSAFDAVGRQIDAVSAIHRELHRSKQVGLLDLSDYLQTLSRHLRESTSKPITLSLSVPSLMVTPKMANSFGTVVSESFANAIKHSFGDGFDGTLNIEVLVEDDALVLTCENNTGGVIAARETKSTGIGQRIMRAAIAQFGGTMDQGVTEAGGYALVATLPFQVPDPNTYFAG